MWQIYCGGEKGGRNREREGGREEGEVVVQRKTEEGFRKARRGRNGEGKF